MPVVWIPALLRDLTGNRQSVAMSGTTIREVVDSLETAYPGIRERLCDGNSLRPGIAVAVGTELARRGLDQKVDENSEVHFLPAISGG
jgi:molybdopterin converting factor small subunit